MLNQKLTERCQTTSSVLKIISHSGFPAYFTQLEQVFGPCEAYPTDQLLSIEISEELKAKSKMSGTIATSQDGVSMDSAGTCVTDEIPNSRNMADDSESPETTFQENPLEPSTDVAVPTPVTPLTDKDHLLKDDLHQRLMTFITKNVDPTLEPQLVELFKNTKSLTAKESLLLSLRLVGFGMS